MMVKEKSPRKRVKKNWSVYLLRCADGSLYAGITNDVERRVKMHNAGTGAKYTRARGPVELLYKENGMTRPQALVRECAIKALPKKKKEVLVLA
jgi:predicted GIY-YIG superfamily endonuclease